MSRNLNPAYIRKLIATEAPNGYKFDVMNYLHNPAYGFDYPRFVKVIAETADTITRREVYYFKHYDGTGDYLAEVCEIPKGDGWHVTRKVSEEKLAESNRFSLKTLLSFC